MILNSLYLCFIFLFILDLNFCKKNNDIYCGACIALIDEMQNEIMKIDGKKLIQVGSFRVDGEGNQNLHQIPLTKSESHLMEILEGVCSEMSNYGEAKTEFGNLVYTRFNGRNGQSISMSNIQIAGEISDRLKFACESVLEDSEDQLITSLLVQAQDLEEIICIELLEICNFGNITDFHKMKNQSLNPNQQITEPNLNNEL